MNEPNARAHIKNHSSFHTQTESALDEVVLDLCGIFQSTRINERIDFFGRLQFERLNASRMNQAREKGHFAVMESGDLLLPSACCFRPCIWLLSKMPPR